ncbi:hypothetical protein LguiB_031563 [Lonicera macranthoides]
MVKNVRARHKREDVPVDETIRKDSKLNADTTNVPMTNVFETRADLKVDKNVNEVKGKSVAPEPIEIIDDVGEDEDKGIAFTPQRNINFVELKVLVQKGNEARKQQLIHNALMRTFHSSIRVFIPLIHENKTHFSLLCLDLDRDGWYHMNPLRPRRANGNDDCYEDVRVMYKEVQRFFGKIKTNGENILKNGFKKVLRSRDGLTKYSDRPLERVEISMISHILQTDIKYKLNVPEICPQQEATSVDCGIVVLYDMKQLAFGVPIKKKFRKGMMHQMQAEIIETFLNNTDAIDPFKLTVKK